MYKQFEAGKTYFRKTDKDTIEYTIESRNKDSIVINGAKFPIKDYHGDTEFVVLEDAPSLIGGNVVLLLAENKVVNTKTK